MHPELKDCPWCGMPLEVVSAWTGRKRTWDPDNGVMALDETPLVTARCLSEHWFAGPQADLEVV